MLNDWKGSIAKCEFRRYVCIIHTYRLVFIECVHDVDDVVAEAV